MRYGRNVLQATALALPLSFGAVPAHAADLVETIRDTAQLETFARALEQAGMTETLRGEGPITIFAPTDEAFEALPDATVEALFADDNRDALETLLGYHIVPGERITAAELPTEVETESGTLYVTMTDAGPVIARSPQEAFGLVQDPEVTAADELQDEEPQAQQRAAEAVATTGTVGQDAAIGILDAVTDLFGAGPEEEKGVRITEADLAADNGVIHVVDYVLVPPAVVEQLPR
jgi:uncharacterized surface protein with fasciclin (FAS1) repeats